MFEVFSFALQAVLPLLLIMLLGYWFAQRGIWGAEFFRNLNALTFRIFLPLTLFVSVYSIQTLSAVNWSVMVYLVLCIPLLIALGILAAKLFIPDRRQKAVLVQAAYRSDLGVFGIPLATALGGVAASGFNSVFAGIAIPIFNISAVIVLTCYGTVKGKHSSIRVVLKQIATNPLIISTIAGLIAVFIRQLLPTVDGRPVFSIQYDLQPVYQTLVTLSKLGSPLALFCLGACLDFKSISGMFPQVCFGVFMRLLFAPLVVIGLGLLLQEPLGLTTVEMPTLVTFSAAPAAVVGVVMAQETGNDEQYASHLVVWSSVFSVFTLFIIILLLRGAGLL